jgi:hypothetical protein
MPDAPNPYLAATLAARQAAHQVSRQLAPGEVKIGATPYPATITYGKGETKDHGGNYVVVRTARIEVLKTDLTTEPKSNGQVKIGSEDFQVTFIAGHEQFSPVWVIEACCRV